MLGWTTIIAAVIGVPYPNGLVPQAPVHTDALTTYKDEQVITDTVSGRQIYEKKTIATHVTEQRISHFLMGLAIIGTMTGPLLVVLGTMPRAVFYGVFFVVGWGSIEGNGIIDKLILLCTERRFIQPDEPLLTIPRRRILYFVSFQLLTWAASVAISQTIAAIGFPVIVTALIPFRLHVIPKIFTPQELAIMDSLTATNDVVLASLGGKPTMKEERMANTTSTMGSEGEKDNDSTGMGTPFEQAGSSGDLRARPRQVPDTAGHAMAGSSEGKDVNEV